MVNVLITESIKHANWECVFLFRWTFIFMLSFLWRKYRWKGLFPLSAWLVAGLVNTWGDFHKHKNQWILYAEERTIRFCIKFDLLQLALEYPSLNCFLKKLIFAWTLRFQPLPDIVGFISITILISGPYYQPLNISWTFLHYVFFPSFSYLLFDSSLLCVQCKCLWCWIVVLNIICVQFITSFGFCCFKCCVWLTRVGQHFGT